MSSNPQSPQSLIETMARAILETEGGGEYTIDEWRRIVANRGTVANHRVAWGFDAARAALQALHDAGPTQRMLNVGGMILSVDGKPLPLLSGEVLLAMIRAELEADNV